MTFVIILRCYLPFKTLASKENVVEIFLRLHNVECSGIILVLSGFLFLFLLGYLMVDLTYVN